MMMMGKNASKRTNIPAVEINTLRPIAMGKGARLTSSTCTHIVRASDDMIREMEIIRKLHREITKKRSG